MSSRQSISGFQGKASLKRTNIGSSKSVQALMVHIDWTDAKVVRIEARQAFAMQAATVKVLRGSYDVLANVKVNVQAGQVIYFVQSDESAGWYYVLLYSESRSAFSCSCPKNAQFHQACEHQQHAMAFVGHRHAEQVARKLLELCITAPATPKVSAEEASNFFLGLAEQEDERREFQAKVQAWEKMQADESARYVIEKEAREVEAYEKRVAWLAEQKKQVA